MRHEHAAPVLRLLVLACLLLAAGAIPTFHTDFRLPNATSAIPHRIMAEVLALVRSFDPLSGYNTTHIEVSVTGAL